MSNEIVKYENRLNEIPLRRFNSREMNLFFSIVSRARDKGTDEIMLSFNDLKELSRYTDHGERFVKDLDSTYSKLISLNAYTDDGNTLTRFVAFTEYTIIRNEEKVIIRVNPKFRGLFNELGRWTRFSLEQFANLKSTYSKTMFRLMKQYRTQGLREFNMAEFRERLDVPKSYRTNDIDSRVLTPIKDELAPIFRGLNIHKLRKGRGGKITGYRFTWQAERRDANDFKNGHVSTGRQKLNKKKRVERVPEWPIEKHEVTDADRKKLSEQLELLRALGNHQATEL